MKSITAKQLQLNLSKVMKEVAAGGSYQVTFHGRPTIQLRPNNQPEPGSRQAFLESLKYVSKTPSFSTYQDDDRIREQGLRKKYGFPANDS